MPTATFPVPPKPSSDMQVPIPASNLPNGLNTNNMTASHTNSTGVQSSGAETTPLATATTQLTSTVDEFLKQLQEKFGRVGEEMMGRMDDMSRRIDGLEAQLRRNESGDGSRRAESGSSVGR